MLSFSRSLSMSHRIALLLAGLPHAFLKGAVYIHLTLAEGFFTAMESVQPAE